ncbi:MAG: CaiB/BaiF CoA-transferase family protein, partial [Spirochaetales bacterium]|nr:CaiB/BaiF CoA-transferase family protein [Spirochaetales bacterium]
MDKPLSGVKVIESALQYPGPYCGMLLAQMGAEVVKLETPGTGDPARHLPSFFNSINCNKKSITLNLKKPEGRQILHRLIKAYDVFMEGFRPGVGERIGIDYNTLSQINPGLIYCSITGYGQDGPCRNLPGHDLNFQAVSGMLSGCFKQSDEGYFQPGLAIADVTSGMFAAISILSALVRRDKTAAGTYIDVSMTDGLISLLSTHFGNYFETGSTRRTRDAGYGLYKTVDGQFIALGIAHEDWFWDRMCMVMGLEQLQGINSMERREKREELVAKLQEVFLKKTQSEWIDLLSSADVPVSPVQSLERVFADPQIQSRQMFQEILSVSGSKMTATNYP